MATKHIGSVGVATESTFGSIAAATGLPSSSGLTFTYLELADRAQLVTPGEPVLTERADSRCGLYANPPEVSTINGVQRRTGTVTLDTPWRPIGDATEFATYSVMPLHKILRTGFGSYLRTDTASDAVSAATDENEWTPTTLADFAVGQLVRMPYQGRSEYCAISADNDPKLVNSPAWSITPTGQTIFPMRTVYLPACGVPSTESVCLLLDGDGWRSTCFGCVLTQAVCSMDETSRLIKWSFTLDCAHIDDDHSSASISATDYADGAILHQMQSYLVIGTPGWALQGGPDVSAQVGAREGRATLCVDAFTLTVDFTRSMNGCGESILTMSDNELVDVTASLEVIAGTTTDSYDDDLYEARFRNVIIGFSGGDTTDSGEGGCIMLPAAFLNVDASIRDMGKDNTRTRLVWSMGKYGGDEVDVSPTTIQNSILRIGMA